MKRISLLMALLALFVAASAMAGTAPTPPFNECPAAGADASCGWLIVFTDNGIGVYQDTSQGPYDGSDDTLVGALNNSSNTVNSITLSGNGNGGGIFAYDGDGVCTYINPPGCGSVSNNTDDWGPNVTFSNINGSMDTGTVNFTGGLAPGAYVYFSLESDLQATNPPVPVGIPEPTSLVLLGTGLLGLLGFRRGSKA